MPHHVVRKVSSAGIITTVAGNGRQGNLGDGGPAVEAQLNSPISVAVDATVPYTLLIRPVALYEESQPMA